MRGRNKIPPNGRAPTGGHGKGKLYARKAKSVFSILLGEKKGAYPIATS